MGPNGGVKPRGCHVEFHHIVKQNIIACLVCLLINQMFLLLAGANVNATLCLSVIMLLLSNFQKS